MSEWNSREEQSFRELVRRAEAQSQDYYRRAGGAQAVLPPAPEPVPIPQPQPQPEESYWVNPTCVAPPVAVATPPPSGRAAGHPRPAHRPPPASAPQSLLAGLTLDSETLLLLGLLWMLWEEEADWKLMLAIGYILFV